MGIDALIKAVDELPMDVDQIDKLIADIKAAYEGIAAEAGDNPTEEQVEAIEALAEALAKAKAGRQEAAKNTEASIRERKDRADKAAAAFADDAPAADDTNVEDDQRDEFADDSDADDSAEGSDDADDSAAEDDTEEEADDEAEAEDEDDHDDEAEAESDKKEDFSVNKRKFGGAAQGKKGPVKVPSPFTLDPAAPNFKSGDVSFREMAEAFNAVSSGRAIRATAVGTSAQTQFGHINRDLPSELTAHDEESLMAAVDHATDEKRLDGNSLVAAGGWCAPSETVYNFLPTPSAANLFSLPEISIARGGLRFPVEPDFSALYDASRFHMTEAEAIAGRTKECIEIPCAEMEEVRMDVLWTCVTSNLLSNKGWPELTAKFLENATKGHLHRLSAARLARVIEESEGVHAGIPTIGTAGTVLNAIELHAESIRQKFRLGNSTLEGVAPAWLRAVMRADLAYRDEVLPERVTDAILDQHLADRGIRFQFVDDYQPLPSDPTAAGYPDAVKVILYPAGTFFSAVNNVVNLGAIYDSTGLSKNQRTELFIEDGWAVGKRGYESREVTIPLDINGQVGLRVEPTAAQTGGVPSEDNLPGDENLPG